MNRDEVRTFMIRRRDLTGETFNDGTLDVWTQALASWRYADALQALITAAVASKTVRLADVVAARPRAPAEPTPPYEPYPPGTRTDRASDPVAVAAVRHGIARGILERTGEPPTDAQVDEMLERVYGRVFLQGEP